MPRTMGRKPAEPDLSTYRGRFAARLRELRTRKYATQGEFIDALQARGLEVKQNTLSGWETGQREPGLDLYPFLADALGVSVRSLLPTE